MTSRTKGQAFYDDSAKALLLKCISMMGECVKNNQYSVTSFMDDPLWVKNMASADTYDIIMDFFSGWPKHIMTS